MSEQKTNELANWFNKKDEEKASKPERKDFDKRLYFSPTATEAEGTKTFQIRILPPAKGSTDFFEPRYYHQFPAKYYDGFQKKVVEKKSPLVCIYNEEGGCPICKMGNDLYNQGKEAIEAGDKTKGESLQKLAQQYFKKTAHVARVIDRKEEDFGIRFWSFDDSKKPGYSVLEKLKTRAQSKGDFTDVEEGRDLIVTKTYNGTIDIDTDDKSPLSTDPEKVKAWLADTRKGSDVWTKKQNHRKYLELITMDKIPFWSKEANDWVEYVEREEYNSQNSGASAEDKPKPKLEVPPQPVFTESATSETDDLPF